MPDQEQLAVGEILDGKYRVEALIGSGGMGAVYRARHISLDSARAIKLMRPELAKDESFVHRFENEAHLAEGVRHPNVVALYDFATLPDGTKYIVWELVEGETLRDCLERGDTFTSTDAIRLVREIGGGLAVAHEQGILHRDVSPDNIMLCGDDHGAGRVAKLLDFGVAKAAGTPQSLATTTGMVFGKIGYASPEQMGLLKGEDSLDARADVFSLAAVAYAMLTGEPPFVTSSMRSFLHDLMIAPESEHRARFAAALEEPWREPLTRALARERGQRPPTMGAFVNEIRELEGSSTSRVASPEVSQSRRWPSLLFAGVALAILVLLSASILRFPNPPRPPQPDLEIPRIVSIADVVDPWSIPDEESEEDGVVPGPTAPPPALPAEKPQDSPLPVTNETPPPSGEDVAMPSETPVADENPDEPPPASVEEEEEEENQDTDPPDTTSGVIVVPDAPVPEDVIGVANAPPSPKKIVPEELQPIDKVEPRYPGQAMRVKAEGTVLLRIDIAVTGDVIGAEVLASPDTGNASIDRLLERSAIDAVLQWKYEPRDEPVRITVPIKFEMTS